MGRCRRRRRSRGGEAGEMEEEEERFIEMMVVIYTWHKVQGSNSKRSMPSCVNVLYTWVQYFKEEGRMGRRRRK